LNKEKNVFCFVLFEKAAVAAAMALSNTSSASSTSESHVLTPIHQSATKSEWMEAIEQQHLERSTLNRLIINYLITGSSKSIRIRLNCLFVCLEGFKDAAEIFAEEAGLSLDNIDLKSVDDRLKIRESIENGRIEDAIDLINKKTPELLDQNRQLAFHLKVRLFEQKKKRKIFFFYCQSFLLATTFNRINSFEFDR